jgi:hypothetical protein
LINLSRVDMNKQPNQLELVEALFKAIAHTLDDFHHDGIISAEEYILLIDSIWQSLDYGTRLPE